MTGLITNSNLTLQDSDWYTVIYHNFKNYGAVGLDYNYQYDLNGSIYEDHGHYDSLLV